MIMGARVLEDGSPDIMMEERVNTALDYITDNTVKIILSGGKVDQEKSEAEVMQNLLIAKGIDRSKFILEEDSSSTFENLVCSKPLILGNDCQKLDIISHDFHLARIKMTADRLDIPINRLIPAKSNSGNEGARLSREYKAYLLYWLGWGWMNQF